MAISNSGCNRKHSHFLFFALRVAGVFAEGMAGGSCVRGNLGDIENFGKRLSVDRWIGVCAAFRRRGGHGLSLRIRGPRCRNIRHRNAAECAADSGLFSLVFEQRYASAAERRRPGSLGFLSFTGRAEIVAGGLVRLVLAEWLGSVSSPSLCVP